jgi:ABC-type transporter Mla MlaB component
MLGDPASPWEESSPERGNNSGAIIEIRMDGELDLLDYPVTTIQQLNQLTIISTKHLGRELLHVHIDLSDVTEIDACALLYLVALVDDLSRRGIRVRGNYPKSKVARAVFVEAEFDQYMKGSVQSKPSSSPHLRITKKSGEAYLEPSDWTSLFEFLGSSGSLSMPQRDTVYQAFGECIENVRQHAFAKGSSGNWYALAIRHSSNTSARAVVLDLGRGIPKTVRRSVVDGMRKGLAAVFESYQQWFSINGETLDAADLHDFSMIRELIGNDVSCLNMATLGMLRRADGCEGRGTGLTDLRKAVQTECPGSLHVYSGTGAISCDNRVICDMQVIPRMRGTMVCVELEKVADSSYHTGI